MFTGFFLQVIPIFTRKNLSTKANTIFHEINPNFSEGAADSVAPSLFISVDLLRIMKRNFTWKNLISGFD